jgi:chorismate mutase
VSVRQTTPDPLVRQLREQISETDRAIVALVNRRLELVRTVQRRKAELGLPRLDPGREERMLRDLRRANRGPLSAAGIEELHGRLLALTRSELEP